MMGGAGISRRGFLRNALRGAAGMSFAGIGTYAYAAKLEAFWFEVVRKEIVLRGLPEAFAGFTIAHISDLHFGRLVRPADLAPAVAEVQSLGADAIVITGDLVSRANCDEPDMIVETVSQLSAPHGLFAVLGNHDWWADGPLVADSLRRAGATVLENDNTVWHRDGQSLYVAGVDDVCVHRHDLPNALAGVPYSAKAVVLVHEPDFADLAASDPRVLLQLSGHSHGGQVCVPGYGGLRFPPWARQYPCGLYTIGGTTLYTNRGLGMIGLPIRFCCRPEITLLTLRPAS
jgi:predicted MPP superfamily phosphohydrolase